MSEPDKAAALRMMIGKSLLNGPAVEYLENCNSRVGIACSGGLDSVAVLFLLYGHFPELRSRFTVLHFNHKLRGEASDKDAAFVKELAGGLDLLYVGGTWIGRDERRPVTEAAARHARQAFYDEFVGRDDSAVIVTGHQQGDILETLMLRIARGSNLAGLSAPKPVVCFPGGKTIVRPLLNISKATLEAALTAVGILWREDASNLESSFDRNRLRNEVIPVWKKATQFDLEKAAGQIRDYLEEADEVIDRYLDFSELPSPSCNPAQLPRPCGPKGVLRRWLNLWLSEQGIARCFQRSAFNEVLELLFIGGRRQWSAGNGYLCVGEGSISYKPAISTPLPWSGTIDLIPGEEATLPWGAKLSSDWEKPSRSLFEDLNNGKYSEDTTVLIDGDCLQNESLLIRRWLPGDRYQPLNASGSRKLQDMYVDRKIPREERNTLPVVITKDSLIIWCPGLPVNHNARVTKKTKKILQLTYSILH